MTPVTATPGLVRPRRRGGGVGGQRQDYNSHEAPRRGNTFAHAHRRQPTSTTIPGVSRGAARVAVAKRSLARFGAISPCAAGRAAPFRSRPASMAPKAKKEGERCGPGAARRREAVQRRPPVRGCSRGGRAERGGG